MSDLPLPPDFVRRLDRLEKALMSEEFCVLVWGSGKSVPEAYAKRLQFKEYLEARLGAGQVFMGEDERFRELIDRYGTGVAEALQAAVIDAVVVLDTSVGPHSELMKYGDILRTKTIVFVSDSLRDAGFASVAYDALKVERYSPNEYADCNLLRQRANCFVQALRLQKAQSGKLKRLLRP